MKRTHYCAELCESDIGKEITVCGWVQTKRDMGGVIFLDIADREGVLQTVFDAGSLSVQEFALAESMKNQSVVQVSGKVRLRDDETVNPKIKTGTIELKANKLILLSACKTLPYSLEDGENVREDLRLKYRFIDLRRPQMLNNLKFRHHLISSARSYLDNDGFIEVETPMLTKSTPEGARDYLVPSRVHPGSFYALPQSPQIFKQLLMVGGIDKYYQVARCFRDEDLRADRQPEFTQVDMELSFVEQEDILILLEKLFKHIFKECMGYEIEKPFKRITWQESMLKYGCDKPDLRFGLEIVDLTDIAENCGFSVFKNVCDKGGIVRAINVKGKHDFSRGTIEALTEKAIKLGAKGMAWISLRPDGEVYSVLTKYFKDDEMQSLLKRCNAMPGDFILFCADKPNIVCNTLSNLRLIIADMLGLMDKKKFEFCFITEFPQFEYSETEQRFMAMHHPFTMPFDDDIQYLKSDPARVRAQAYDVVLNGVELGSGSIRIHNSDIQNLMFEALGFDKEQIEKRFGFMVNAFKYGTPPHGGFAFGVDRLAMLLLGADSLRDVIAFPKNKDAVCPMTDAPTPVDYEQLKVLGLTEGIIEQKEKQHTKAQKVQIDVKKIAELSKLKLSQSESEMFKKEMADIIGFADQLSEADTSGIQPAEHIGGLSNVLREDKIVAPFNRDLMLKNAKTKADGYITVPKVIE